MMSLVKPDAANTAVAGWRWAPAWVLAFVALWPAPGVAEAILVLGALVGLVKLIGSRFRGGAMLLGTPAWALTSVLFCAYWLPEVIAAVDAVDQARGWREVLVDLRYLPFLWVVASAVANEQGRRRTFDGLALLVGLWTLDALAEAVLGASPLFGLLDQANLALRGHSICTPAQVAAVDRLSGILGPCNLKLGIVLASMSPFALDSARRWLGRTGWVAVAIAMGGVIVLAGSRASWLTYALVLLWSGVRLLGWKWLTGLFVFGGLALALASLWLPQVHERVARTAHIFSADEQGVDTALSGRGRIWSAAVCMFREHPLNGVGPRGFREYFRACDPCPEKVAAWGDGVAMHAHQVVLEVLSETGSIGLLLWLSAALLGWRAWRYADAAARERTRPAMMALAISVFPLNTHLAAYSTFWGGVLLLLSALYAGSLWGRASPASVPAQS